MDKPAGRLPPARAFFFVLACLAGVTLLEYRTLNLIQGANLQAQVDVAAGILSGYPYWKAYQNRILGPEIVKGLARLTGRPFADVYQVFCLALLGVANVTCYFLFWKHGRRAQPAWLCTAGYAALFIAFQDAQWLYLWDFIDLTVMLLFAWAVVIGGASLGQLAALFAVELLNRESAQFIALWIVVDSVRYKKGSRVTVDFPRLATGVLLGIVGNLSTSYLRNTWCIQEVGVVPRREIYEFAGGQFFMLRVTFDLLREFPSVPTMMLLLLLGAFAYLFQQSGKFLASRAWKVGLIIVALVAANFCLAFILEMRVWFGLLPFLLCLAYFWRTHADRGGAGVPRVNLSGVANPSQGTL